MQARQLSTSIDMACFRERPALDRFSTRVKPVVEKRAINVLNAESFKMQFIWAVYFPEIRSDTTSSVLKTKPQVYAHM